MLSKRGLLMIIISDRQRELIDAFFVLLQENPNAKRITIKDVSERAGIRRQSVYEKHFHSMDELIDLIRRVVDEDCEEKIRAFVEENNGTKNDPAAFFANEILPLLYKKRDWLKILYGSSLIDTAWVDYLQKKYTPLLKIYLDRVGNKTGLTNDFLCKLIVKQVLAILACWLTADMPEPVSLFKEKFIRIFKTSVYGIQGSSTIE
jgi:AcrR family transcriptional regulator